MRSAQFREQDAYGGYQSIRARGPENSSKGTRIRLPSYRRDHGASAYAYKFCNNGAYGYCG